MTASPPLPTEPIVVKKKGAADPPNPRTSKLKEHADLEARKVSAELGKVCDEAFWRHAKSSSLQTTPLQTSSVERTFVSTPPSSISRPSPRFGLKDPFFVSNSMRNRPLPPTPMVTSSTLYPTETPVTYTTRELAGMRERLAIKYAREGTGNQKYFNDVLRQLDNLMKPVEGEDGSNDSRRIVSAPPDCHFLRGSMDLNPLDSIPEEGRPNLENVGRMRGGHDGQKGGGAKRGDEKVDTTIRVVASSPPSKTFSPKPAHLSSHHTRDLSRLPFSPQPLNIRKNSSSTNNSSISEANEEMGNIVSKNKKRPGDQGKLPNSLLHIATIRMTRLQSHQVSASHASAIIILPDLANLHPQTVVFLAAGAMLLTISSSAVPWSLNTALTILR